MLSTEIRQFVIEAAAPPKISARFCGIWADIPGNFLN